MGSENESRHIKDFKGMRRVLDLLEMNLCLFLPIINRFVAECSGGTWGSKNLMWLKFKTRYFVPGKRNYNSMQEHKKQKNKDALKTNDCYIPCLSK